MLDVVNPPPPALIVRKRKSSTGVDLVVDEAQSSIEGLEPPERQKEVMKVVVVHGDPTKPNSILPGGQWDEDDFECIEVLKRGLNQLEGYSFSFLCNHDTLMTDLQHLKSKNEVDLVLQFCDEGWQNHSRMELHICALLEMFHIPYSGSGPACIGITLDKQTVLGMATTIGIPVPRTVYVEHEKNGIDLKGLKFPVLVKPNSTDGSFGITKKNVCRTEADLHAAIKSIREVFNVHGPLLIQEYLEGRDVNCAIIGNPPHGHTVLPITEEDYSSLPAGWPKICGFESKWDPESPYWNLKTVPTTLDKEKQQLIADCSTRLFHRLGVRDYARFDWRLDSDGNPHLLEANPNCGWCDDGHMAKTCNLAGISYPEMLRMLIEAALSRSKRLKDPELKYIDLSLVR
jgi:D-alanine-D-alanine ligase